MNLNAWGKPQQITTLAEGVVSVSTAGHGGIVLSKERNALVPADIRMEDGAYEEDCDWAIAWMSMRKAGVIPDNATWGKRSATEIDPYAIQSLHRWRPDHVKDLTGQDPDPNSPILLARRDYATAREQGLLLVVSATASSASNSVPPGMVGVVLSPAHPTQEGPDRSKEVYALIEKDKYSDSRLDSGVRMFAPADIIIIKHDPFEKPQGVISPKEAYEIASTWGSFVHTDDPGRSFYTFPFEDARPQNVEHRKSLIDYTRKCMEGGQDLENLRKLEMFFLTCDEFKAPEKVAQYDSPSP